MFEVNHIKTNHDDIIKIADNISDTKRLGSCIQPHLIPRTTVQVVQVTMQNLRMVQNQKE